MTPQQSRKLYDYSFDFIRISSYSSSPLTTNDVPTELIKFWLVYDFLANPLCTPTNQQVTIFAYACSLYDSNNCELYSFRFYRLFFSFQVILATTYLNRVRKIDAPPVRLFDFTNYGEDRFTDEKVLSSYYNKIVKGIEYERKWNLAAKYRLCGFYVTDR